MATKKILLIEDDPIIHRLVQAALKGEFEVQCATSVAACEELLQSKNEFNLFIVDRTLPDGDGLNLCAKIKEYTHLSHVPVIFLSAKDTEADKVSGLFAGADDYITKPFGPLELRARIQARLRSTAKKLTAGDIKLDPESLRVWQTLNGDKNEILVTPIEFKILSSLVQSVGQVLQRQVLLDRVWGPDCHINDRVVDTHVSHLRKKLAGSQLSIEALRGEGYRLNILNSPSQAA